MRTVLIFIFLTTQVFSNSKWFVEDYRNADGSYGNHKEIVTSLVLLSFLSHGETATSKKFGLQVKTGLKYLIKKSAELDYTKINPDQAYIFWALSEAYAMTGVKEVGEAVDKMAGKILPLIPNQKIKKDDILTYSIISHALYACKKETMNSLKEKDLKLIVEKIILRCWSFRPLSIENSAALLQMSLLWDIDLKKVPQTPLTPNLSKEDNTKLDRFMDRLNSDSKSRKLAREEIGTLSAELYFSLINKLSQSGIVELQETAKELMCRKLEIFDHETTFKLLKNNPSGIFSATHSYFIKKDKSWKFWNKENQKYFGNLQSPNGSWDDESLKAPENLNLNKTDKIIFNTSYAALNLTVYYTVTSYYLKRGIGLRERPCQ